MSDLDFARSSDPEGSDVEAAGFPGWFATSSGEAELRVDTGPDVIRIDLRTGTEGEPTYDQVRAIAEVAIPRILAALRSVAGPLTDAELARDELIALFPERLGSKLLDVG